MGLFLLETTNVGYGTSLTPIIKFIIVVFVCSLAFGLLKDALKELKKSTKHRRSNSSRSSRPHGHQTSQPIFSISAPTNISRNDGELQLEHNIHRCINRGYTGYYLHNLYVPKPDGTTTEIDAVYITAKGIFVFESKDYSGWIFGGDTSKQWMQTFPNGSKNPFPNPIWQNDVHIQSLGNFLKWKIPFFSFVVFSDNCEIKKMSVVKSQAKVIQQYQLVQAVINTFNAAPDIFNDEQMKTILRTLKPLTNKTAAEKDAHIANVQNRHNANENTRAAQPIYVASAPVPEPQPEQTKQSPVCPLCGKALQERVAQNGDHAGQTYEVCTDYPNCKYAKVKE